MQCTRILFGTARVAPRNRGPLQHAEQIEAGLFDGTRIARGKVHSGKYDKRNRRQWQPNAQMRNVYSRTLDSFIYLKTSARAQRSIMKSGGLDDYLFKSKPEILGPTGLALREQVLRAARNAPEDIYVHHEIGRAPSLEWDNGQLLGLLQDIEKRKKDLSNHRQFKAKPVLRVSKLGDLYVGRRRSAPPKEPVRKVKSRKVRDAPRPISVQGGQRVLKM